MNDIKKQLIYTLDEFKIEKNIGEHYRGKVRDNYYIDDQILMITSDRVSAFDCVLGTIPFKGQILTEIANFWFDKTKDIVPNHIISSPDPQVLIAKKAKTLPVEIIIRQYITGSLWREYSSGINGQYGFDLEDGFKENQKFETLIITPSTKAEYGEHDQPISRENIVNDLSQKLEVLLNGHTNIKTLQEKMNNIAPQILPSWNNRIDEEINLIISSVN